MRSCTGEIQRLIPALNRLQKMGMAKALPQLGTVAVAAAYGVTDNWNNLRLASAREISSSAVDTCASLFQRVLAASTISHLCNRGFNGPLSTPAHIDPTHRGQPLCTTGRPYLRNYHFGASFPGQMLYKDMWERRDEGRSIPLPPTIANEPVHEAITLPVGAPVRWSCDLGHQVSFPSVVTITDKVVSNLAQSRQQEPTGHDRGEAVGPAIFCSTPRWRSKYPSHKLDNNFATLAGISSTPPHLWQQNLHLSAEQQRIIAEAQGERPQEALKASGGGHDVVKWLPYEDMPICEACGSGRV